MNFTVEQFGKYLRSQDSFGDAMYNLKEENVDRANITWERGELMDDDLDERIKEHIMNGVSPSGRMWRGTGVYIHDELEEIREVEEV